MTDASHPAVDRVTEALAGHGLSPEIVWFDDAVTTAPLAAAALGIEVGQIANSLVFTLDDEPILVLTSGAHRVDTEWLGAELGGVIGRASKETVKHATGQVIGGVAPGRTSRSRCARSSTPTSRGTPSSGLPRATRRPCSPRRSTSSCASRAACRARSSLRSRHPRDLATAWPGRAPPARSVLRPPTSDDLDQVLVWRNDPDVIRWLLRTTVDPEKFRTAWLDSVADPDQHTAVALLDGVVVGTGRSTCATASASSTGMPGAEPRGCSAT